MNRYTLTAIVFCLAISSCKKDDPNNGKKEIDMPYVLQGSKITPPAEVGHEGSFGNNVMLSGDGKTAVVSAPKSKNGYVYVSNGSGWSLQQSFTGCENDISISSDGNVIAFSGNVYTRSGGMWIKAMDGIDARVMALSEDGSTMIVDGKKSVNLNGNTETWDGAVVYSKKGIIWEADTVLGWPENVNFSPGNLSVSGDGKTIVIIQKDKEFSHVVNGSAFIFKKTGSAWALEASNIKPSNPLHRVNFGQSVSVSYDGNTAAIGVARVDINSAVYVFNRGSGNWAEPGIDITASLNKEEVGLFGKSVSLSKDGLDLVCNGSLLKDVNGYFSKNSVFCFSKVSGEWRKIGDHVIENNENVTDYHGYSVALSGDSKVLLAGTIADPKSKHGYILFFNKK